MILLQISQSLYIYSWINRGSDQVFLFSSPKMTKSFSRFIDQVISTWNLPSLFNAQKPSNPISPTTDLTGQTMKVFGKVATRLKLFRSHSSFYLEPSSSNLCTAADDQKHGSSQKLRSFFLSKPLTKLTHHFAYDLYAKSDASAFKWLRTSSEFFMFWLWLTDARNA